jgi:hypothetical protein
MTAAESPFIYLDGRRAAAAAALCHMHALLIVTGGINWHDWHNAKWISNEPRA